MRTFSIAQVLAGYFLFLNSSISAAFCDATANYSIKSNIVKFVGTHALPTDAHEVGTDIVVAGADVKTFKVLPGSNCGSFYAIDKNSAYFSGRKISEDPANFKANDVGWAEDSKYVYLGKTRLSKKGFRFLGHERLHAVNEEGAYLRDGEKLSSNPEKFKLFGCSIATDQTKVFANKEILPVRDASTFKSVGNLSSCLFEDKFAVYRAEWDRNRWALFQFENLEPNAMSAEKLQKEFQFLPAFNTSTLRASTEKGACTKEDSIRGKSISLNLTLNECGQECLKFYRSASSRAELKDCEFKGKAATYVTLRSPASDSGECLMQDDMRGGVGGDMTMVACKMACEKFFKSANPKAIVNNCRFIYKRSREEQVLLKGRGT